MARQVLHAVVLASFSPDNASDRFFRTACGKRLPSTAMADALAEVTCARCTDSVLSESSAGAYVHARDTLQHFPLVAADWASRAVAAAHRQVESAKRSVEWAEKGLADAQKLANDIRAELHRE